MGICSSKVQKTPTSIALVPIFSTKPSVGTMPAGQAVTVVSSNFPPPDFLLNKEYQAQLGTWMTTMKKMNDKKLVDDNARIDTHLLNVRKNLKGEFGPVSNTLIVTLQNDFTLLSKQKSAIQIEINERQAAGNFNKPVEILHNPKQVIDKPKEILDKTKEINNTERAIQELKRKEDDQQIIAAALSRQVVDDGGNTTLLKEFQDADAKYEKLKASRVRAEAKLQDLLKLPDVKCVVAVKSAPAKSVPTPRNDHEKWLQKNEADWKKLDREMDVFLNANDMTTYYSMVPQRNELDEKIKHRKNCPAGTGKVGTVNREVYWKKNHDFSLLYQEQIRDAIKDVEADMEYYKNPENAAEERIERENIKLKGKLVDVLKKKEEERRHIKLTGLSSDGVETTDRKDFVNDVSRHLEVRTFADGYDNLRCKVWMSQGQYASYGLIFRSTLTIHGYTYSVDGIEQVYDGNYQWREAVSNRAAYNVMMSQQNRW